MLIIWRFIATSGYATRFVMKTIHGFWFTNYFDLQFLFYNCVLLSDCHFNWVFMESCSCFIINVDSSDGFRFLQIWSFYIRSFSFNVNSKIYIGLLIHYSSAFVSRIINRFFVPTSNKLYPITTQWPMIRLKIWTNN